MTIEHWWDSALGSFKKSPHRLLSEFEGIWAVDISIFMNKFSYSDIDRLAMTCIPPYPAPDMLQNIMAFHRNLSKHITPLYVFDGIAPSLKEVQETSAIRIGK